ncbi:MAG: thioredoxin domain-containing protein [Candidatus Eisenbacteria bacterium]|uniref:Thioredoxin domain-containing protein n=1 Tax=Eiseniibacteriota bacterium TaxID=2212470 RepID=A0A7Y2H1D2_UNCEI|nr:thioredoxin domain-containing protein [Candidatus Eisenbacteria bacterium]
MKTSTRQMPLLAVGGLIGAGLIASGYLLYRTFTLLGEWAPDRIDICSAVFGTGCDATLLSPSSWQLGVPLAGWGLVYFGALAMLLILGRSLGNGFSGTSLIAAQILNGVGLLVSALLLLLFATGKAKFCPVCLVIHGINVALAPMLHLSDPRSLPERVQSLRRGVQWLLGHREDTWARWYGLGFATATLAAIMIWQWVLVQTELRLAVAEGAIVPAEVIQQYEAESEMTVLTDDTDPRLGPVNAPAELVVFSSFQCPGCRSFAEKISQLRESHPSELSIVFKHFPLGTACNPDVGVNKHPRACQAALAAEAARYQEAFWPFHDALFAGNLRHSEEQLSSLAESLGLDLERFNEDRHSSEVNEKLTRDVALGSRLEVDATPTVFLNGRRVRSLNLRAFQVLVEHAVSHDSVDGHNPKLDQP